MKFYTSMCLLTLTLSVGCQSFSSTMLNRLDNNSFQGNSNGFAKIFNKTRPYKGVPITLEVPSHLDIYIDETYYTKLNEKTNVVEELMADTRILDVRPKIIKTAKVFTVDFKRPGSGTLKLGLAFNEKQYFDSIKSEINDTTIKDTAALVGQVIGTVKAFSTSSELPTEIKNRLTGDGIIRDTRVVAYQRFDISSADFEFQVEEFVNKHLNNCNQCGTLPSYDMPNMGI